MCWFTWLSIAFTNQVAIYPVRYSQTKWEYLLLHRVPLPDLGAFWQGITGGVESGENLLDAAHRELTEETGFKGTIPQRIGFEYIYPIYEGWKKKFSLGVKTITEHVYVALIKKEIQPKLSHEHDAWKWCDLAQALTLLHFSGNIESIKKCDEFLKQI